MISTASRGDALHVIGEFPLPWPRFLASIDDVAGNSFAHGDELRCS